MAEIAAEGVAVARGPSGARAARVCASPAARASAAREFTALRVHAAQDARANAGVACAAAICAGSAASSAASRAAGSRVSSASSTQSSLSPGGDRQSALRRAPRVVVDALSRGVRSVRAVAAQPPALSHRRRAPRDDRQPRGDARRRARRAARATRLSRAARSGLAGRAASRPCHRAAATCSCSERVRRVERRGAGSRSGSSSAIDAAVQASQRLRRL